MKITIELRHGVWWVGLEEGENVWPWSHHGTRFAAAARVLQLLDLDMVAAQQHPEQVCIGEINGQPIPPDGGPNG